MRLLGVSILVAAGARNPIGQSLIAGLTLLALLPATSLATGQSPVCIAPSSAALIGMQGEEAGHAIDEMLASYLRGPRLEIIRLESRLPAQARHEAVDLGCAYTLFTTVKQQRRNSAFVDRIAAGAIYSGAGSAAGVVESAGGRVLAGAVSGAAGTVVTSNEVRTRDQMILTYRLEAPGGRIVIDRSEKRRAGADHEDVLTPLIEAAAEAVVGNVLAD